MESAHQGSASDFFSSHHLAIGRQHDTVTFFTQISISAHSVSYTSVQIDDQKLGNLYQELSKRGRKANGGRMCGPFPEQARLPAGVIYCVHRNPSVGGETEGAGG